MTIRLFGLKDVGIHDYDTAYYANIAKVPIFTIDWFFDKNTDHKDLDSLSEYLKARGSGVNIIKPGHVFFNIFHLHLSRMLLKRLMTDAQETKVI